MENLFSGTWNKQSSPHLPNTPMYGGKPVPWLCAASFCYQTFCWPWTASVLFCSLRAFFFLLLFIFSPHINYTDVLGAMCFATSQGKPQAFRSEDLPDVLAWQIPHRGHGSGCQTGLGGSQTRMGPSPAPRKRDHGRKKLSAHTEQHLGTDFASVWFGCCSGLVCLFCFSTCTNCPDSLRSELPVYT